LRISIKISENLDLLLRLAANVSENLNKRAFKFNRNKISEAHAIGIPEEKRSSTKFDFSAQSHPGERKGELELALLKLFLFLHRSESRENSNFGCLINNIFLSFSSWDVKMTNHSL
jgi:hypothetical protein